MCSRNDWPTIFDLNYEGVRCELDVDDRDRALDLIDGAARPLGPLSKLGVPRPGEATVLGAALARLGATHIRFEATA